MGNEHPERWRRMQSLFNRALALDADRRDAWLDRQCRGDETLRRELDGLLNAADGGTEIIEATIRRASLQCPDRPERPTGDRPLCRAFACIATFFRHSARARRETDPVGARADLLIARAFGRAAAGEDIGSSAEALRTLLETLAADGEPGATAAALRRWLDVLGETFDS